MSKKNGQNQNLGRINQHKNCYVFLTYKNKQTRKDGLKIEEVAGEENKGVQQKMIGRIRQNKAQYKHI